MRFMGLKSLIGYRVAVSDGDVGAVSDFYFDDADWSVRYLVVDTGNWLTQKHVLIAPQAIDRFDYDGREIHLGLSSDKVESAPEINTDLPVGRRMEAELNAHYGWAPYWGAALPEANAAAGLVVPEAKNEDIAVLEKPGDPNLRSVSEVIGYSVECKDGDAGTVSEFVIPDRGWPIRYLVVDTGNWLPGRQIILAPEWVDRIDWAERKIHVDLSCESIEESTPFESIEMLDRKYEEDLYAHYSLIPYW